VSFSFNEYSYSICLVPLNMFCIDLSGCYKGKGTKSTTEVGRPTWWILF